MPLKFNSHHTFTHNVVHIEIKKMKRCQAFSNSKNNGQMGGSIHNEFKVE